MKVKVREWLPILNLMILFLNKNLMLMMNTYMMDFWIYFKAGGGHYHDRDHLALPIMEHRIGRTIVRSLASFLKKVENPISKSSEWAASTRRVKVCYLLHIFVIRAHDLLTDHKQNNALWGRILNLAWNRPIMLQETKIEKKKAKNDWL